MQRKNYEWQNRVKELEDFIDTQCRKQHYYCGDSWYSCPKHPDGCADPDEGPECNCGADAFNKQLDEILGKEY